MGIIPVPDSYGDDCRMCFPRDETPSLLKVFFSGMKIGEKWTDELMLPPNGYHDYVQSGINACLWQLPAPHPVGNLSYAPLDSGLSIYTAIHVVCFWGLSNLNCVCYFENRLHEPEDNFYWGGTAFVCTPHQMETWLNLVTPTTGPDPRLELFPMPNGEIVLKFCSIQDGTNIKIKLDTALL